MSSCPHGSALLSRISLSDDALEEGVLETTRQSRLDDVPPGGARIGRNAVLVTEPELVHQVLTSAEYSATRHRSLTRRLRSPEDRAVRAFYDGWPMFADGEAHAAGRRLAGAAIDRAQEQISRRQLEIEIDRLLPVRPHAGFDWLHQVARPFAGAVAGLALGLDDSADVRLVEAFSSRVLDDLAERGTTAARSKRLGEEVAAMTAWLRSSTPQRGVLAPYSEALRSGSTAPSVVLGSMAQVVTGLRDPLTAAIGGLPLARAVFTHDDLLVQRSIALTSPFRFTSRFSRSRVTLGEFTLHRGDRVVVHLGAASLATELLHGPERRPAAHFGFGNHYCMGARLVTDALGVVNARLETSCDLTLKETRLEDTLFLRYQSVVVDAAPVVRG